jgi:AcrR family transcriptional regulator
MRSDTRRNIDSLLTAVSHEVGHNPGSYSLQSIANRAGVSTATAYRYFSSLDELLRAYMVQILESLRDYSRACDLAGSELFDAVMNHWVQLVLEHGRVMVQLRSRTGFLERLDHQDSVITVYREIWERPLAEVLADLHLKPELLRQALFICNALSDPREILDLHRTDHLTPDQIVAQISASVVGGFEEWPS